MIQCIRTVTLYVADQQAALLFYVTKLGFELRARQSMGDAEWIEVAPPGSQTAFVLYPRALMADWASRKASVILQCADVEKLYEELSGKGVEFTQTPKKMPWSTFATFRDPDGNEFLLRQ